MVLTMDLLRIILKVQLLGGKFFKYSGRDLYESLASRRCSISSSHGLSITASRPGAVGITGLALWSHFAIPGEITLKGFILHAAILHTQMVLERSYTHWTQHSEKLTLARSKGA